jgi:REP element-mobilizing transposase RayT
MTQVESPGPHRGWYSRGYLPHWDHPGMIQSINFRLADAMPQAVLERWGLELGLGALASRRREGEHEVLSESRRQDASAPSHATELRRRIEEYLDAGHGECWLRRPDIAALVEGALLHFDTQRYLLLAWCVMPNHVHALIETKEGWPLDGVVHSWKSYTSHEAGRIKRRAAGGTPALPVHQCRRLAAWERQRPAGEFWQREYLDRYVRNAEHYTKVVAYIEDNPVKAGLAKLKTDWPWSSARFRFGNDSVVSLETGNAGVSPASPERKQKHAGETPALPEA